MTEITLYLYDGLYHVSPPPACLPQDYEEVVFVRKDECAL